MSQDIVADNPPVTANDTGSNTGTAVTPNPLEAKVADLEAKLAQANQLAETVAQQQALLQQYQTALGSQRQGQSQANDDTLEKQFDEPTRRFVDRRAQQIAKEYVDKTVGRLAIQADIQQKASDPEVTKAAQGEYQTLKQNPYYSSLPDEVISALAVDRARASVLDARLKGFQADADKRKAEAERIAAGANASLPSTGNSRFVQPTADDPDADLKHYWAQPESKEAWRRMLSDTGFSNVSPDSEQEIRLSIASKPEKARDVARRIAIRAVRTGVGVGANLYGAIGGNQ